MVKLRIPRRAFVTLPLAALAGGASTARAELFDPPAVDVGRIAFEGRKAVARASNGELAELTLDAELSSAAARLLDRARPVEGAILALDPRTGRLLVWAEKRLHGPAGSVITSARSPAASVFKLITTAALYETGGVEPKDRICISGGARRIERGHLDSPRSGEVTCAPFAEALGHSRNAVYAQLATHRLLRDDLIHVAERIGFNANVPFDWAVPLGRLSVPYNDLDFARTAAGFQGSTLSPLGAAFLASIIAQGGLAQRLRLIRRTLEFEAPSAPEVVSRAISATTAWRLTRMMEVTVHSGTSRSAFVDESGRSFLPGIRVAGKTGTLRPEHERSTASWFIGFAPSRDPEIVISVLLRNGAVWRERAAEVARDVLRAYFHARGVPRITEP